MGYKVPKEARCVIEIAIRRYPENKKLYEEEIADLIHRTPENDGMPHGSNTSNPTEELAIKIAENTRLSRMKREIEAVEEVYSELRQEYQKVIRVRFWTNRYNNKTYMDMEPKTNFRERQMQRIVTGFVYKVGKKLGEI